MPTTKRFPHFEEADGDYYDAAETDLDTATAYVRSHWDKFSVLPD